ncbi:hypothetical protein Cpir12675_001927 [Ceratocystis pirilliformis]|uniref:Golgi apparatus membrane protein tvp38 n=1 Tax=Ceratocystis pirilliformis TaxID=259994 RepID=A0ABR3ZDQ9_9PEZI
MDLSPIWGYARVLISYLLLVRHFLSGIFAVITYVILPLRLATHALFLPFAHFFWDLALFLCSPVIEVVLFFASWVDPLVSCVVALKPLYTFFGVSALVGFIAGTACFAISYSLVNLLGLNSANVPYTGLSQPDDSFVSPKHMSQHPLTHKSKHRHLITAPLPQSKLPSSSALTSPISRAQPRLLSPPPSPRRPSPAPSLPSSPSSSVTLTWEGKQARVRAHVGEIQRQRLARLHSLQQQARQKTASAAAAAATTSAITGGEGSIRRIPQTIVEDTEAEARTSS